MSIFQLLFPIAILYPVLIWTWFTLAYIQALGFNSEKESFAENPVVFPLLPSYHK